MLIKLGFSPDGKSSEKPASWQTWAYLGHQLIQERILSDFTANPVAMKGAPLSGFVGNNE